MMRRMLDWARVASGLGAGPARSIVAGLLASLWTVTSGAAEARVIVIVADEFCPFNCKADAREPGALVELAQRIFADAGYRVEYRVLNWARAVEQTRSGESDGLVGASRIDVPDFVFADPPPVTETNCLFTQAGMTWTFTGIPSLKRVSLGAVNGYRYGQGLDEYIASAASTGGKVELASGDAPIDTNVRKLLRGRIDAMVEDYAALNLYLATRKLDPYVRLAGCFEPIPMYLAFSPARAESKTYADIFGRGLVRLQQIGEYQKILSRYGLATAATLH